MDSISAGTQDDLGFAVLILLYCTITQNLVQGSDKYVANRPLRGDWHYTSIRISGRIRKIFKNAFLLYTDLAYKELKPDDHSNLRV